MSKETMALADDLYEKLTKQFTAADFARFEFPRLVRQDWPTLLKIKLHRAELLYAQKAWDRCGPAFDAVVTEDPKGTEAASAAYASALCYERAYLAANAGKPTRLDRGAEAIAAKEISPLQKAMLASFDRFLCVADPASTDKEERENAIEVAYARARVYFEAHRWPEAAAAFRAVAMQHPEHETGIFAAQLYLEALNVMASHGQPACFAEMQRDLPQIQKKYCDGKANAEQCGVLARVQRDVGWQVIEDKAKRAASPKDWEEVAEAYLALWNEQGKEACAAKQPACERMDQVLFNSAKAFAAARLVAKAIAVRKIILDPRYGLDRTAVGKQTALDIGKSYQAIAVYDDAAAYYERFAHDNPADEKAPTALEDAITLRLGLGQEEQALKDAELFDRSYRQKHPAEAARIAFAMGAHHAEHDNLPEARRKLSAVMAEIDRSAPIDVQIQAHAVLGRVLWRTGGETGAAAEFAKVRALYRDPAAVAAKLTGEGAERRLGRTLSAVGEALYFVAEQKRKGVDAIKFPAYRGSGRREDVLAHINTKVDAWMKQKMPAVEEAEREYRKVLDVTPHAPPRWVIASGARVGQLWSRFVAEFRAAPVPKEWMQKGPSPYGDLTWEEIRFAYLAAIDVKSEPYRVRAKEAYKTCLGWSTRYQHFDESSRACEVWLAKNYPTEFHAIDELRGTPSRIAAEVPREPLALVSAPKP
jgi:tetratricopeptide (TPR) repeat protein